MIIETSTGLRHEATNELIHEVVHDDARRGEFLILNVSEQVYLQATGEAGTFHVESRDGGEDRHYYAKQKLNREQLEELMLRYFEQRPDWNDGYDWAPLSELQFESGTTWDLNWS